MAARKADMTVAQAMDFRAVAIAKGVGRDLIQSNTAQLALALDAIKQGARLKMIPAIAAPSWGGRIYTVRLRVDEEQEWQDAINAISSQTPGNYNVRRVGDLYLPTNRGVREVELVLVSLAGGGDFARAVAWAGQYDLKRSSPRQIFTLGRSKPNLHREFGMNPMYVASGQECTFGGCQQVCYVWWGGSKRRACLHWAGNVGLAYDWVAFARE